MIALEVKMGRPMVLEPATSRCRGDNYHKDKVDDAVPALFFLTIHDNLGLEWKGHDCDALGRLHSKGRILDPVGRSKSVVLTEEDEKRCEELSRSHFGIPE
jgi:hypothetical protein